MQVVKVDLPNSPEWIIGRVYFIELYKQPVVAVEKSGENYTIELIDINTMKSKGSIDVDDSQWIL